MTETDSKKIVASLLAAYTNYKPPDIKAATKVWLETMREYSYEEVNAGLNIYMQSDTKGFPPVPGQIIEKIHTMAEPNELNEMEAWSLVSQAIRNSGYNSILEFTKLPPLVQKAVGIPDQLRIWALDEHYNESVVSSNFIKCYRSVVEREKELQKMSPEIRKVIELVNKDSYAGEIEQKRQQAIERNLAENKVLEMKHDKTLPTEGMIEDFRKRLEEN